MKGTREGGRCGMFSVFMTFINIMTVFPCLLPIIYVILFHSGSGLSK